MQPAETGRRPLGMDFSIGWGRSVLFVDGGVALAMFALWVFCIIDAITTPADKCRNLPKIAWIFLVIMLSDAGSIAWLIAGRPWGLQRTRGVAPGSRIPAAGRPLSPDDDEEFLASLRARAEEQRRAREAEDGDEDQGHQGRQGRFPSA